jgi:lipoprotein-anchoring transpeptidase ErfK/SrfK
LATADNKSSGAAGTSGAATAATAPVASNVQVSVLPAAGSDDVRPDAPIQVTAAGGTLQRVTVLTADGTPIDGSLAPGGRGWTSAPGLLPFDANLTVRAEAVDEAGWGKVTSTTIHTLKPKGLVTTSISPVGGSTVGVGMPVIVKLSATPGDRATVERSLTVTADPPVTGSWAWLGPRELHWRPEQYWKAGTKVTVGVDLAGKDLGDGVWGKESRNVAFRIGAARVATVDIAAHTMTVTQNGAVVRVIPVTTGRDDKWPTRQGTKVIMTKERKRVMDSTTVDIPPDSPDGYVLEVEYAMRLTGSGEFIHAAPWSVKHQGVDNVSHGCTGMSLENAAWLFENSSVGDVVTYVNGLRSLESGNGWTDWNTAWPAWQAKSALV